MDFLEVAPVDSYFGTTNLLPDDGAASLYWPYQVAQNLNFIYCEASLLMGFKAESGMSSPYQWHIYLPAGTYSFFWSIKTPAGEEGTISGTLNGTRLLRLRQLRSSEEGYESDEVIYHVNYMSWINPTTNWYRMDYDVQASGNWVVSMYYCMGVQSRWWENYIPGAEGAAE